MTGNKFILYYIIALPMISVRFGFHLFINCDSYLEGYLTLFLLIFDLVKLYFLKKTCFVENGF